MLNTMQTCNRFLNEAERLKHFVALKKNCLPLVEAELHNIDISYSSKGNFIFPIASLINKIFKVSLLCSQF